MAAALRPRASTDQVGSSTRTALCMLGRRVLALDAEKQELDEMLERLVEKTAPELLGRLGVGVDTAATLLVTAGDNPGRIRSEGAWAHLCGVAPIQAFFSSPTRVTDCPFRGGVVNVGDSSSEYCPRRVPLFRWQWCQRLGETSSSVPGGAAGWPGVLDGGR